MEDNTFKSLVSRLKLSRDELIKGLSTTGTQVDQHSGKEDFWGEISNYQMLNDQCVYMLQTIPTLVKKKIIK